MACGHGRPFSKLENVMSERITSGQELFVLYSKPLRRVIRYGGVGGSNPGPLMFPNREQAYQFSRIMGPLDGYLAVPMDMKDVLTYAGDEKWEHVWSVKINEDNSLVFDSRSLTGPAK
jgi:hypothetical protein